VQFLFYICIGGLAAIVNLLCFVSLIRLGLGLTPSVLAAFFIAAGVNYYLSVKLLFRHRARWNTATEVLVYLVIVIMISIVDLGCTSGFVALGVYPPVAKIISTGIGLFLNFAGRRFVVFPEKSNPDWKPQNPN
jgi:putative flippase GtrA